MTTSRTPVLCGFPAIIAGSEDDAYVASLPDGEPYVDEVLPLLEGIVPSDATIVDVGANIGVYTIALASLAPAGRVHAFEPNPETVQYLRDNVRANELDNVTVHEAAVSASAGTVRFKPNPSFLAGSTTMDGAAEILEETFGAGAFDVPATTLDDLVEAAGLERLDLVKIDTEGHELDVLAGAMQTLDRFRPVVILEFSTFALTVHRATLPADALEQIRATFDRVFVASTGGFREVRDQQDAIGLLRENATAFPVQDLFGVFDDGSRLAPAVAALADDTAPKPSEVDWLRNILSDHQRALDEQRARADEAERALDREQAENAALRRTLSWRVTRPLRAARRLLPGP